MRSLEIIDAIRQELARRGTNAYRAAIDSGLPADRFRYIKQGRDIKLSHLVEACDALGLEIYVGPPRATVTGAAPPRDLSYAAAKTDFEAATLLEAVRRIHSDLTALVERYDSSTDLAGQEGDESCGG